LTSAFFAAAFGASEGTRRQGKRCGVLLGRGVDSDAVISLFVGAFQQSVAASAAPVRASGVARSNGNGGFWKTGNMIADMLGRTCRIEFLEAPSLWATSVSPERGSVN
jgi:hypothetical protein